MASPSSSSSSSYSSSSLVVVLLILLSSILFSKALDLQSSSSVSSAHEPHIPPHLKSTCESTPHPEACFDSLKLSLSISINPTIAILLIQSLRLALTQVSKLSILLAQAGPGTITETQRGALDDCRDLHQISISSIQKSLSRIGQNSNHRQLSDAKVFLSAALTNKNTCLEGLDTASGPLKPLLVNSLNSAYQYVSNSLSLLSNTKLNNMPQDEGGLNKKRRRLLGQPSWMSKKDRRILQSGGDDDGDEYDPSKVFIVAGDGSGNFTSIMEAVNFAPNNSEDRILIFIREGVYNENVVISSYKTNIVFLGDGSDVTVITGNRSVGDGWTTFRSATVAVSGDGFLARDISFVNTAGPEKHQAVALRINADLTAVYKCTITGYQDSLYVHSFRQFYRECDISGTIDFIFGNAAVVIQAGNIIARLPMHNQFNAITAQSRDSPDEDTGMSIQNCSIIASDDLYNANTKGGNMSGNGLVVKSYLGRPWRPYSRTVYMESFIDDFIDPSGWKEWSGDVGLDTLYYGEYSNNGPGSVTDNRVGWMGYHVMDYDDASNFTVSQLIVGDEWLDATSFPYDDGV
ncbi:hypothetical protein Sjap_012041 [Stephania japonica]|uniref:Pectinesterase n=1 Tax=Stephania japonica TaxID=461633 RepID=A0AAP0JCQ0_9MAGN